MDNILSRSPARDSSESERDFTGTSLDKWDSAHFFGNPFRGLLERCKMPPKFRHCQDLFIHAGEICWDWKQTTLALFHFLFGTFCSILTIANRWASRTRLVTFLPSRFSILCPLWPPFRWQNFRSRRLFITSPLATTFSLITTFFPRQNESFVAMPVRVDLSPCDFRKFHSILCPGRATLDGLNLN